MVEKNVTESDTAISLASGPPVGRRASDLLAEYALAPGRLQLVVHLSGFVLGPVETRA
jgi:hypothetical protein